MDALHFAEAMAIIAECHTTEVLINKPKDGFVGDLGERTFSIHITKCCAGVVKRLCAKGYTLSLDENCLKVEKI